MDWLTEIPLQTVGIGSGWALVVMYNVLIARGGLHTDREWQQTIDTHKRELDDVAHDRDEWRTESRIKDQQLDEQGIQIRAMAEGLRTVEAVMHAIHDLARSGGSKETTP